MPNYQQSVCLSDSMLVCLTVCWSVWQYVGLLDSMLVSLTVCWSVWQYVGLSDSMLVCLTVCWSACQYVSQSDSMLVCLTVCWSVWQYVGLFDSMLVSVFDTMLVCLRVCWSVSLCLVYVSLSFRVTFLNWNFLIWRQNRLSLKIHIITSSNINKNNVLSRMAQHFHEILEIFKFTAKKNRLSQLNPHCDVIYPLVRSIKTHSMLLPLSTKID